LAAQNFTPVNSGIPPEELFGELQQSDTEWLCTGGFATETQIWYVVTEDGKSVMCQIIHSAVGYVLYPSYLGQF
jgi:hypothetical protein